MAETTAVSKETISDKVLTNVQELQKVGGLAIPKNYSAENALKSAWLILQDMTDKAGKAILPQCTSNSVKNSLLDMVVQGLSPSKNQCYFIKRGQKLTLSRSYLGTIAVTKRLQGIENVKAYCLYEGDDFKTRFNYKTGSLEIEKYEPSFENINSGKMKGAFALILGEKGPVHLEVMNMSQVKAAWGMGTTKGNSKAHNNFGEEMAKKSVINRACKVYANTSDDSDILIESMNNTDKYYSEDESIKDIKTEVQAEIKEEANKEFIDIEEVSIIKEETKEEVKKESEKEVEKEVEIIKAEIVKAEEMEDMPY